MCRRSGQVRTPMVSVRLLRRLSATAFGVYCSCRAASRTASCLAREMLPSARPLSTSETVLRETPARSATSCAVARRVMESD